MAKRADLSTLKVVKPGKDQKPLVSARGDMITATVNLPREMLTLLRRVAVNRADTAGGRPSVSDVVREILEKHRDDLEDEAR